jgi:Putative amidoligase enzyme
MSLSRILGKPKGAHSFAKDPRWVLGESMIGLEFEYEGVRNRQLPINTFAGFWSYHEEGSLKDNGAEYVFTQPLFGADAYNALEWLVNYARGCEWKCTKRTGIHVHLDIRDLETPQLVGLCILYAALEPILYRWIGDGRENSHFCLPLYKADQALLATCNVLSNALNDSKVDGHSTLDAANSCQRYAGFNLQALAKFGSIEFRHMQTTHNLERVVDWVNMIMSLKEAAFKLPQSDGAVVRMMERMGAWGVLNYVFNAHLAGQLYNAASHTDLMEFGLPSARDIGIHACQDNSWKVVEPPRGEHPGFKRWQKDGKIEKPQKLEGARVEFVDEEDVFEPDEDDVVLEDRDPVPAPQAARPVGAAQAEERGLVGHVIGHNLWAQAFPDRVFRAIEAPDGMLPDLLPLEQGAIAQVEAQAAQNREFDRAVQQARDNEVRRVNRIRPRPPRPPVIPVRHRPR